MATLWMRSNTTSRNGPNRGASVSNEPGSVGAPTMTQAPATKNSSMKAAAVASSPRNWA